MSCLAAGALVLGALLAGDDVIDVVGVRREQSRPERPGQTLVIRPEDPSRFDVTLQLHQEASLEVPETGRVSASGFAVPRVRGEDERFTDVYVEGMLLQDPFSGLPLVDELDLQAFGELTVHEGVPPPELPSVNPIGVLQYRLVGAPARAAIGSTVGSPYGLGAWASEDVTADAWRVRTYVRRHVTDGRYRYYDDNGTPYNTADDSFKMRQDNWRQSDEFVPVAAGPLGGGRLTALAVVQSSGSGIPSLNGSDSQASATALTTLATARYARPLTSSADLAADVGVNHDARTTEDPSHTVIGPQGSSSLSVDGTRVGLQLDAGPDAARLFLRAEGGEARVQTSMRIARESASAYAGASLLPLASVTVELKLLGMWTDDRANPGGSGAPPDSLTADASPSRRAFLPGETAAALWHAGGLEAYVQGAVVSRSPSLMEEFGDGALVRPNPALDAERTTHREAGVGLRAAAAHVALAAFQDDTADRIVLVPSLAQSLRAENLGMTEVQGAELRADATAGRAHVFAGATRLVPEDLSNPAAPTVIPGVAATQAALGAELAAGPSVLRWNARYRSQVYRDVANQIVVPGAWIHDASVDMRGRWLGADLALGFAVLNVFDVEKLPVAAPATPANRGETAYEDLDGYPLPGRQWRVSVVVAF